MPGNTYHLNAATVDPVIAIEHVIVSEMSWPTDGAWWVHQPSTTRVPNPHPALKLTAGTTEPQQFETSCLLNCDQHCARSASVSQHFLKHFNDPDSTPCSLLQHQVPPTKHDASQVLLLLPSHQSLFSPLPSSPIFKVHSYLPSSHQHPFNLPPSSPLPLLFRCLTST